MTPRIDNPALMLFRQPELVVYGMMGFGKKVAQRLGIDGPRDWTLVAKGRLDEPYALRSWVQAARRQVGFQPPEQEAPPLHLVLQSHRVWIEHPSSDSPEAIEVEDIHVDHVVRCLATGSPILFTVDRAAAKVFCNLNGVNVFLHDLRHHARTMALSEVVSSAGADEDGFGSAFAVYGRQLYIREEPMGGVLDMLVQVLADGRTAGWVRKRRYAEQSLSEIFNSSDDRPEDCSSPLALQETHRRFARDPAAAGFEPVDMQDHLEQLRFWKEAANSRFGARREFQFEEPYKPPAVAYGRLNEFEEPFLIAAAAAVLDDQAKTLAAASASASPPNQVGDKCFDVLKRIDETGRGSVEEVRMLQQTIAATPCAYHYPQTRNLCRQGQSAAVAFAAGLLASVKTGMTGASPAISRPLEPKDAHLAISNLDITVDELARAARIGLPLMTEIVERRQMSWFESYLAVQALIARRNTHIRPRDLNEMRIYACLLTDNPIVKSDVGSSAEERRIGRAIAARLDRNNMTEILPSLNDVDTWTCDRLVALGIENESRDPIVAQVFGKSATCDLTSVLIEAAAIRMGGARGLKKINDQWHRRLDAFEDARLGVLASRSGEMARDLVEELRLPTIEPGPKHVAIRCLVSADELSREGRELGHCVRAYDELVRSGRSFILRMESSHQRSTAELRLDRNGFRVAQHEIGGQNPPGAEHAAAVAAYVASLNSDKELTERIRAASGSAGQVYASAFNHRSALDHPELERLYLDQISELYLPHSMRGLSTAELTAHLEDLEQVEHLKMSTLAASPDGPQMRMG